MSGFSRPTRRMSLTEVVYKIRNDAYALCDFTGRHPEVKVVVNQTSWDDSTRSYKAVVSLAGPEDRVQELAKTLAALNDTASVVSQTNAGTVLRVVSSLDTLRKSGNPVAFAIEYFGEAAIAAPALLKDGFLHTRLLVTGKVDIATMLGEYEKGVKSGRWTDFKLVRIDNFDPEQQIQGSFAENLTQKQLEVIKTALALGFYNTPRDVTLDDLSNIFGISKAAVHNRLQAAERKVISKYFS